MIKKTNKQSNIHNDKPIKLIWAQIGPTENFISHFFLYLPPCGERPPSKSGDDEQLHQTPLSSFSSSSLPPPWPPLNQSPSLPPLSVSSFLRYLAQSPFSQPPRVPAAVYPHDTSRTLPHSPCPSLRLRFRPFLSPPATWMGRAAPISLQSWLLHRLCSNFRISKRVLSWVSRWTHPSSSRLLSSRSWSARVTRVSLASFPFCPWCLSL